LFTGDAGGEGFPGTEKSTADGAGFHFQVFCDLAGIFVVEVALLDDVAGLRGEGLKATLQSRMIFPADGIIGGGRCYRITFDDEGGEVFVEKVGASRGFSEFVANEVFGGRSEPRVGFIVALQLVPFFEEKDEGFLRNIIDPARSDAERANEKSQAGVVFRDDGLEFRWERGRHRRFEEAMSFQPQCVTGNFATLALLEFEIVCENLRVLLGCGKDKDFLDFKRFVGTAPISINLHANDLSGTATIG